MVGLMKPPPPHPHPGSHHRVPRRATTGDPPPMGRSEPVSGSHRESSDDGTPGVKIKANENRFRTSNGVWLFSVCSSASLALGLSPPNGGSPDAKRRDVGVENSVAWRVGELTEEIA